MVVIHWEIMMVLHQASPPKFECIKKQSDVDSVYDDSKQVKEKLKMTLSSFKYSVVLAGSLSILMGLSWSQPEAL